MSFIVVPCLLVQGSSTCMMLSPQDICVSPVGKTLGVCGIDADYYYTYLKCAWGTGRGVVSGCSTECLLRTASLVGTEHTRMRLIQPQQGPISVKPRSCFVGSSRLTWDGRPLPLDFASALTLALVGMVILVMPKVQLSCLPATSMLPPRSVAILFGAAGLLGTGYFLAVPIQAYPSG